MRIWRFKDSQIEIAHLKLGGAGSVVADEDAKKQMPREGHGGYDGIAGVVSVLLS